jgi:hypothetical protein
MGLGEYKLTITLVNFQGNIKVPNNNKSAHLGRNFNYYEIRADVVPAHHIHIESTPLLGIKG